MLVLNVNMILVTVPLVQESEIQTQFQVVIVQLNIMKMSMDLALLVIILAKNVQELHQHVFLVQTILIEHFKMMDLVLVILVIQILVLLHVHSVLTIVKNVQEQLMYVLNVGKVDQDYQTVHVMKACMIMALIFQDKAVTHVQFNV